MPSFTQPLTADDSYPQVWPLAERTRVPPDLHHTLLQPGTHIHIRTRVPPDLHHVLCYNQLLYTIDILYTQIGKVFRLLKNWTFCCPVLGSRLCTDVLVHILKQLTRPAGPVSLNSGTRSGKWGSIWEKTLAVLFIYEVHTQRTAEFLCWFANLLNIIFIHAFLKTILHGCHGVLEAVNWYQIYTYWEVASQGSYL